MTSSLSDKVRARSSQVLGTLTVIIGIWLILFIDRSEFGMFGVVRRVLVLMLYFGSSVIDFQFFKTSGGEGSAPLLASSIVLRFLIAGSVYFTIGSRNVLSHLPGSIMLAHVLAVFVLMVWKILDNLRGRLGKRH